MNKFIAASLLYGTTAGFACHYSPYVGVTGGVQLSHHRTKLTDVTDTFNPSITKATGIIGLTLGYRILFNNQIFTDAEVEGLFGQNKADFKQDTTAAPTRPVLASVDRSFLGSFAVKVGRQFGDVAPYARLGVEVSRLKVNFQGADPTPGHRLEGNRSFSPIALVPGIGVDFKVNPKLHAGLEVRTAFHRSKTFKFRSAAGDTGSARARPRFSMALVRLKWAFD